MVKNFLTSNKLVPKMEKGKKLLTLELDLETLAEFGAAARVFGARSKATFLNQYVVQKIREAKGIVSESDFAQYVAEEKVNIEERSKRKSLERLKIKTAQANSATKSGQPETKTKIKTVKRGDLPPSALEQHLRQQENKSKSDKDKGEKGVDNKAIKQQ